METPKPVNLNALKNILANAKKVMNKTEELKPTSQSSNIQESRVSPSRQAPIYDERDEREPQYAQHSASAPTQLQPRDYTKEDVLNSNLPPIIKEAMLKNPIPRPKFQSGAFSLEQVSDLIEKPSQKGSSQLNENVNSDMITISKTELNNLIDKKLSQFLANAYNEKLTKETIKRTINTLISEGKLNVKKKTIK